MNAIKTLYSTLTFVFAFAFVNVLTAIGAEKNGIPVTTLMQKEFSLGHVEVHLGEQSIARMDCTFGNVIFDRARNNLTIFSEKTGKYCEVTEHDFNHKRKMFTQHAPYSWPMSEWKVAGKEKVAGKPTTKYERHCTNLPPSRQFIEECWLYSEIKTPPWLPKYLNMVMCVGTPTFPGAVLRFKRTWIDTNNRREPKEVQVKLDTTQVLRRTMSKDLFVKPKGLTKVKDEMEVTMGEQMEPGFKSQLKKFSKE